MVSNGSVVVVTGLLVGVIDFYLNRSVYVAQLCKMHASLLVPNVFRKKKIYEFQ